MTYAAVGDLRAEGVTEAAASTARLESLLAEATALIDRATGWFFEPRFTKLRLDGRGTPTIELPVPPIRLDRLWLGAAELAHDDDDLVVIGAPVGPRFEGARLTRRYGNTFPRGVGNVVVEGLWGYTENDGTTTGRTPPSIRRACMLLVLRNLAPLNDDASAEARSRWRLLEETTRDQSYRLAEPRTQPSLIGDPEIDELLLPYIAPSRLGAA